MKQNWKIFKQYAPAFVVAVCRRTCRSPAVACGRTGVLRINGLHHPCNDAFVYCGIYSSLPS